MTPVHRFLAQEGLTSNLKLHVVLSNTFTKYQGHETLSIVFAQSLLWTAHAHDNDGFLDYAIPFFESTAMVSDSEVRRHAMRGGHDTLATTLINLRHFKNDLKVVPDFHTCSAKDFVKFQKRAYTTIVNGKSAGTITYIGPWLFLGPMKIILCAEQRLWNDPDIDTLILPSGVEVIRGIRILLRDTNLITSLVPEDLVEIEGDIYSGHSRDCLINNQLKNIAVKANSTVLHINTACQLLGMGEISLP
jgi:hypothetical protein